MRSKNIFSVYGWIVRVIKSVNTYDQGQVARNLITNFEQNYCADDNVMGAPVILLKDLRDKMWIKSMELPA